MEPKIIDTHSHLNFPAYQDDLAAVLQRTKEKDMWTINVGTSFSTSQSAVALAEKEADRCFASVGLHPMYAAAEFLKLKTDPNEGEIAPETHFDKEKYKALAQSKKVVAIGEIGLDYYYKPKSATKLTEFKAKQAGMFLQQLELAQELDLPLILHCRVAHDDLIALLKDKNTKGVVHCFTGTWQQAQQYIDLGYLIGINGIIFKLDLDEVIKNCPLEKMVVETDCPYLTPGPEEGKRNEPVFITHTIEKIAQLKGISFDQVCQQTTQNARELFGI